MVAPSEFNVERIVVPIRRLDDTTNVVDAAALAKLWGYLKRAPNWTESDELIARDAFLAGFRAGARFSIECMTVLSTPDVRRAFLVLGDLCGKGEAG